MALAAHGSAALLRAAAPGFCKRWMSAIGGRSNPLDVTRDTNPQLHQEASVHSGTAETEAFELQVPGVAAFAEPGVPKPGTVQPPNPSPQLLERVPIAKVTHEGDVITANDPEPPAGGQPRN